MDEEIFNLLFLLLLAGQEGLDTVYCSYEGNIFDHYCTGLSRAISYPYCVSFIALFGAPQGSYFD